MGTVIKLYSCMKCGAILDEIDTMKQEPCPCGGRMMKPTQPTRWTVFRYVARHPGALWTWFKENVCGHR